VAITPAGALAVVGGALAVVVEGAASRRVDAGDGDGDVTAGGVHICTTRQTVEAP